MHRRALSLLTSIVLLSCGRMPAGNVCEQDTGGETFTKAVHGDTNWRPVSEISDKTKSDNARITAWLNIPAKNSRCTGFLINRSAILTSNHCVPDERSAYGLTANFGNGEQYLCEELIATDSELDFSAVRCAGAPGLQRPKARLASALPRTHRVAYIIQQNCDWRKRPNCLPVAQYADGKILGSGRLRTLHNADTLAGSSGSPVLDAMSGVAIAIHSAGRNPGAYGANDSTTVNFAVPLASVASKLRTLVPDLSFESASLTCPL